MFLFLLCAHPQVPCGSSLQFWLGDNRRPAGSSLVTERSPLLTLVLGYTCEMPGRRTKSLPTLDTQTEKSNMPDWYLDELKFYLKKNSPAQVSVDVACQAKNLCLSKRVSGAGPQLGNTFKPYRSGGADRCGCKTWKCIKWLMSSY